jgi:sugar phosphate isomerase/epimerase
MMELSLFSISDVGLWGQQSLKLPTFIAKAAQLGYDAIMLAGKRPHLSPLDAPPDRLAAINNGYAARTITPSPMSNAPKTNSTATTSVALFLISQSFHCPSVASALRRKRK